MPLTEFVCPDNGRIEIKECLAENGCRMGDRCATRSYLRLASSDRPKIWLCPKCKHESKVTTTCLKCNIEMQLKFSTTMLLAGTMEAFLKFTQDYATAPDSRAFMVVGTRGHAALESYDDEYSLLEEKFDGKDTGISGIADVLECEGGKNILVDTKVSGSFKIAKALGFYVDKEETGEIFKSGQKKGQPKYRNILKRDDSMVDRKTWEQQLSRYAMEFEKRGFKIDEIRIQAICRDGGTFIARSRGCFRNIYYFKINRIPDKEITVYFNRKKKALHKALRQGYQKEICTAEENWESLKCQRYCDVAEFCPYGKFLKVEKVEDSMAIKGLSEIRRLPRLGKIRLGIKKMTKGGKEYPSEVDYFILDPQTPSELENKKLIDEFHKLYGDQPKSFSMMFPVANSDTYFPVFYKRYGSGTSLQCKGDGEFASCSMEEFAKGLEIIGKDEMGLTKVKCNGKDCPYYANKKCSEVGVLQVLIPDLPGIGVWQITTGSFHSIVNLNSCIDFIKAVCGRAHMIPLTLERVPQITTFEGKKATHYVLSINMEKKVSEIQKYATIDPTQALLELPEPEAEKEDILFRENIEIEPAEEKETVEPKEPEISKGDKIAMVKMIERIARFDHAKEADNWNKKHEGDVAALCKAAQAKVIIAFNEKMGKLQAAHEPPIEESDAPEETGEAIKPAQIKAIEKLAKKVGPKSEKEIIAWIRVNCKLDVESMDSLTSMQGGEIITKLQEHHKGE